MRSDPIHITREQVLMTALLTLCGAFFYFLMGFPFSKGFCIVAFISAMFHFLLAYFFPVLSAKQLNLANLFNIILLGFAIHYTGGIISPFSIAMICVLISGSGYAFKYNYALLLAVATYLSVIGLEYFGILQPIRITPRDIFKSGPTTALVATAVVLCMTNAGRIYEIVVQKLRSQLEQELSQKETVLKKLSRLDAPSQIGLMSWRIAHDLRGPLGAISGFIQLIQKEPGLSPESREDCQLAIKELTRIFHMVQKMTEYCRPGQSERQIFCPVEFMNTMLSILAYYPGAKRVRFETNLPQPGSLSILANKEELQQVYFNILKNALEALESPGIRQPGIKITASQQEDYVEIAIQDNGPGISQELLAKLSRQEITTKKDGSGIGLIICREILEAHGGNLYVESPNGQGVCIRTRLPSRK